MSTSRPSQSGWGNASDGNGQECYWKSVFFQGDDTWYTATEAFGLPHEIAFRLTGVPAPGALALLALVGLVSRRRR